MLNVINPATEEVVAKIETDTKSTIDEKFQSLKSGQKAWAALSVFDRAEKIAKFEKILKSRIDDIAADTTKEMGKPLSQAKGEIEGAIYRSHYFVEHAAELLKEKQMNGVSFI